MDCQYVWQMLWNSVLSVDVQLKQTCFISHCLHVFSWRIDFFGAQNKTFFGVWHKNKMSNQLTHNTFSGTKLMNFLSTALSTHYFYLDTSVKT
jgi:hypothetical protein